MDYTVWNETTGIIQRSGQSSRPDLQAGEGERVIIGKALDDLKYRINVETGEEYEYQEPADLTVELRRFLASIDSYAEEVRSRFITNTPSQPAVYMAKEAEALMFVADTSTNLSLIPNIVLEAQRNGESLLDVAIVILTQANTWRQVSAMIEDRRLGAKDAVRLQTTVEGMRQAAAVDWSDIEALLPRFSDIANFIWIFGVASGIIQSILT